jgi:multiple sugar transport system ATP-binding protein
LGATVILVTHDQADAFAIADRVAVMIRGAILQCDPPRDIYDTPACAEVAGFIGNPPMNLLPAILAAHEEASPRFETGFGAAPRLTLPKAQLLPELKSHVGKEILLGFRPEHVSIASNSAPDDSAIPARITSLEYAGADLVVQLSAGPARLAARVPAEMNLAPGQEVNIALHFPKCLCYDPISGRLIPSQTKGPSGK